MRGKNKPLTPIRAFISYAAADRAYAERLFQLLSQHPQVKTFSADVLSAGEAWADRLQSELSNADLFFVVLSPRSLESEWVLTELGAAWANGIRIIPVVTHPDLLDRMPVSLRDAVALNVQDLDDPETVARVVQQFEKTVASRSAVLGTGT
jgi:hypothetical protein